MSLFSVYKNYYCQANLVQFRIFLALTDLSVSILRSISLGFTLGTVSMQVSRVYTLPEENK